ncbi:MULTISPECIES: hypothetical protein [Streptomyces]|uniref:Uncharacterized protein n=1 Tax=Streptomyces flaveolus TaxID=67297 RepID=A0ABV3AKB8_9ACTN|nr:MULTISPECIES: hypothetical protein [Streptomyces]MBG7702342.1 hypothetical protein [Streptomyces sp. MC1]
MAGTAEFAAYADRTAWEVMKPDAGLPERAGVPCRMRTGNLLTAACIR